VVRTFLSGIYFFREDPKTNHYLEFIQRRVKRWKELQAEQTASETKLICRICEQMVSWEKFMVHTDLCVKKAEAKKRFQEVDEMLLNLGEELTEKIKTLNRTMYFLFIYLYDKRKSKKETKKTISSFGSPRFARNKTGGILQKYKRNMPVINPGNSTNSSERHEIPINPLNQMRSSGDSKKSLFSMMKPPSNEDQRSSPQEIDPSPSRMKGLNSNLMAALGLPTVKEVKKEPSPRMLFPRPKGLNSALMIAAMEGTNNSAKSDPSGPIPQPEDKSHTISPFGISEEIKAKGLPEVPPPPVVRIPCFEKINEDIKPETKKITTPNLSHRSNIIDPDSFKVTSKQKDLAKKANIALGLQTPQPKVTPRSMFKDMQDFKKPLDTDKPANLDEAKEKFLKSRQALAKFAPKSAIDESKTDLELTKNEERKQILERLKSNVMPVLPQQFGKTTFLKQRNKIKQMREIVSGKAAEDPGPKPFAKPAPLRMQYTTRNLFAGLMPKKNNLATENKTKSPGLLSRQLPGSADTNKDKKILPDNNDPLSKVMQRFLKNKDSTSPANKIDSKFNRNVSAFEPGTKPPAGRPPMLAELKKKEISAQQNTKNIGITTIKEEDEEELPKEEKKVFIPPFLGRRGSIKKSNLPQSSTNLPVMSKNSSKSVTFDLNKTMDSSISKFKPKINLKEHNKLHGILPGLEMVHQSRSETTTLVVFFL